MLQHMYTMFDNKAQFHNFPFTAHNDEDAKRIVRSVASRNDSPVSQYPQDFDLFFVGTFDNAKGVFDQPIAPRHIANAIGLKPPENVHPMGHPTPAQTPHTEALRQ